LPAIVNLNGGDGPSFTSNLVGLLSTALGMPLRFVEQNAQGAVTLSGFNGGLLSIMPYNFQTGDSRANGVYPVGNGQYQAVANGQSLVIAAAVVHLDQLTALLPGISAKVGDNGVITAILNGAVYVVLPGVGVGLEAATGTSRLVQGGDGVLRFIDALGNSQVLNPAFGEPATLRSILQGLDPSATLNIQLDGTAFIKLNGKAYTLMPDMTLGGVPSDHAGQAWWQESATRYRWLNLQTPGASQGFTVRP
jgi:hypothetical protein